MKENKISAKVVGAGVVGMAALSTYLFIIRPWHLKWGATGEETQMPLYGDEITTGADYQVTHAITVNASAGEIWHWLAQIGQGRGGFYSYSWLENLFGLRIRNADRVMPEFQHPEVGDFIRAAPPDWLGGRYAEYAGWHIVVLEPERALVLRPHPDIENNTWAFILKPIDGERTRLIARVRGNRKRSLPASLFHFLVGEPAHFIMERKMLLEIKRLVEASAARDDDVREKST